eukprot:gene22385-biopygen20734
MLWEPPPPSPYAVRAPLTRRARARRRTRCGDAGAAVAVRHRQVWSSLFGAPGRAGQAGQVDRPERRKCPTPGAVGEADLCRACDAPERVAVRDGLEEVTERGEAQGSPAKSVLRPRHAPRHARTTQARKCLIARAMPAPRPRQCPVTTGGTGHWRGHVLFPLGETATPAFGPRPLFTFYRAAYARSASAAVSPCSPWAARDLPEFPESLGGWSHRSRPAGVRGRGLVAPVRRHGPGSLEACAGGGTFQSPCWEVLTAGRPWPSTSFGKIGFRSFQKIRGCWTTPILTPTGRRKRNSAPGYSGDLGAWTAPPDPRGSPGSPGAQFRRRWSVAVRGVPDLFQHIFGKIGVRSF